MTGFARSVTRFARKATPKELPKDYGTDKAGDAALKTHFAPRIPQDNTPVVPLPDEEALGRARRRSSSRRRGARAATVLSGGDEDSYG